MLPQYIAVSLLPNSLGQSQQLVLRNIDASFLFGASAIGTNEVNREMLEKNLLFLWTSHSRWSCEKRLGFFWFFETVQLMNDE